MAGKAVLRTLLILVLIGTAHVIKPFSIKNITQHLLYTTRSFKFVLPVRLRDNFDHANYLAINLSNTLFDTANRSQNIASVMVANLGAVAIKVQPLEEVNKSATRQKSCTKRSAPAKRVVKPEKGNNSDWIASINADEILPVELPQAPNIELSAAVLPVIQPRVVMAYHSKAFFVRQSRPIEFYLALRKSDCEKREAAPVRLITLIEEATKLKATLKTATKQKAEKVAVIAPECEEQETEFNAEELEIEVVEPEEEIIAPQSIEEHMPGPLSMPIEECTREP
jgi:hypothetical protein